MPAAGMGEVAAAVSAEVVGMAAVATAGVVGMGAAGAWDSPVVGGVYL